MTTHRTLSDSEFDTHTSSLTTASLSAKLTAWRALQTDLTTESTSIIEAQREQLYKHRAKVDDMVTDLETLESFQAAGGGGDPLPAGKRIYVDAAWGGSTKDGTRETPYSDLGLALDAKCAPTDAVTRVFVLAAGTYQISATKGEIEKTGAGIGQDITIVGAGSGKTIIQKADLSADCLKLQKFGRVIIKDLSIQQCKYGAYLKDCTGRTTLEKVHFEKCGSSGVTAGHDGSMTATEQIANWANAAHASNGGATRIQACAKKVFVRNCTVYRSARGLRIQDCQVGGIVEGNFVQETYESGIYLASGSYDGAEASGCRHITIQNNHLLGCANNSILVIGGKQNSVISNRCADGWNAGIQAAHTQELTVQDNDVENCNHKTINGLGVLGDAWGQIVTAGNTNIPATTKYQCKITGNRISRPNQGRQASKIGIKIQNDPYASESNKLWIQDNLSEGCDTHYSADNGSINVVDMETRIQAPAGFSFQGDSSSGWYFDSITYAPNVKRFISTYYGDRAKLSQRINATSNGSRTVLLKFAQGHLKHSTVIFSLSHYAPQNIPTHGTAHSEFRHWCLSDVTVTDDQGTSWDKDTLVLKWTIAGGGATNAAYGEFYINVRIFPADKRYYHQNH